MKPLKWHRVTRGLVASSVKSAREYKIDRDHQDLLAPSLTTYTAWTRRSPIDPWREIEWHYRMRDAKRVCQKYEDRT